MDFKGKSVLITAGPTREPIDPVRYISNHSSGKMGYAIAEELALRGANVLLISGPTNLSTLSKSIEIINVESAAEMNNAVQQRMENSDIGIFAAAVADYTPKTVAQNKIKKTDSEFAIEMVKTVDILKTVGQNKKAHQTTVGFALETNNEEANAQKKLETKNCDFIVLNSLQDANAGFGHDTNKVTFISKTEKKEMELKSKKEVAKDICDYLLKFI